MVDDEVGELTAKVNKLVDVFEEALDELKEQEPTDNKEVLEALNEIKEQNAAIAEAVVALADMMKELKEENSSPQISNSKLQTSKGFPPIPPRRTLPRTEEDELFGPRVTSGLPPIPKKKGLFR